MKENIAPVAIVWSGIGLVLGVIASLALLLLKHFEVIELPGLVVASPLLVFPLALAVGAVAFLGSLMVYDEIRRRLG